MKGFLEAFALGLMILLLGVAAQAASPAPTPAPTASPAPAHVAAPTPTPVPDNYQMKFEDAIEIDDSCELPSGATMISQINVVIANSQASDLKALTPTAVQIKVCSPFTDPVNQVLSLPLPVALLRMGAKVPVGQLNTYPVNSPKLVAMFGAEAPEKLNVGKIDANTFELRYVHGANTKIGPIRVTIAPAASLIHIPGFDATKLALAHVEVYVAEKNVTLRADLAAVKKAP